MGIADFPLSRLEELLAETLGRRPEERAAFLDEACAGDHELRSELDELLELNDDAARFFEELSGDIAGSAPLEVESAARPRMAIGPYRTLEAIGQGGMGAVYRAERIDGEFDQEVALKLLHQDMDTPGLRARFLHERQLLAGLAHPNIARLLDGGVTDEGRPYFVMELVEGTPITRYCRDRGLSGDRVLRLFLEIVDAVSYLHRNLVVHRDLKPSNIFVDRDGRVKLLDFGIAKLLAEVPGSEPATRTGQLLMTPEYAAPEQLRGEPVTTATDVYALGVLLYELLTGRRPYDPTSPRDELPATPSSTLRTRNRRVSDHGGRAAVLAAPERRVSRDLDAICLKALRPDADARYRSAEQLGQDIERHLEGLPVRARPATAGYRIASFVRRHRAGVAVAAVVAALLVTGLVREIGLRGRAERAQRAAEVEAAKAVAASEFLAELLSSVDPSKAQGEDVLVTDVLEQASERIDESDELSGQPEVEAAVRRTIGNTHVSLGRYEDALEHHERAAALLGWPDSRDPPAMSAAAELGVLYHRLGWYGEAEELLKAVLDARVATLGEEHPASLSSLNHLADLYFGMGRIDEVEPLDRRTLEIRRRVLGPDHPDTLRSINALAATLHSRGRYAEAAPLFAEGLEIRRRTLGDRHPDTLMLANNLAAAYLELGRYAQAEALLREVVEGRMAVLGADHDQTAMSIHNLGVTLAQLGRYDEAETELRRAIEIRGRLSGVGRSVLFSQSYLADVLRAQRRFDEAAALYLEVWAVQRERHGADDGDTLKTASGLAELRSLEGDLDAAEALLDEIIERQIEVRGDEHPDTLQSLTTLAHVRCEQERFDEALELCDRVISAGSRSLGPEHTAVLQAQTEKVAALDGLGRRDEADELAAWIVDGYRTSLGEDHPSTIEAQRRFGERTASQ
ncbi:MAG: serine/threonine-protein kinase [Thermoanaerobaculales bacterium]|jgi:serine/threonine-protein kinase|nr:serine/threonine-protein kinase [Thermoanaerobaculales bacterium]